MNIEKELIKEYCKLVVDHKLKFPCFPIIRLSAKLKAKAGTVRYNYDLTRITITISKIHYEKFGLEITLNTLRHEVAHIIVHTINPDAPIHGTLFKVLCKKLGGTMNPKIAGSEFKECASSNYVPRREWAKRY